MPSLKCKSCLTSNRILWSLSIKVAEFTCFTCELDLCSSCSRIHGNHRCVRLNSAAYRQEIKRMWEEVMNEADGREKFMEEKAEVCDIINVETSRNQVTGMGILKPSSLVVCEAPRFRIRLFDLRNYALQRDISMRPLPFDVTEVDRRKSQSLSSDSTASNKQGTNEPKPRGLLAVTFPEIRNIVFLDLNYQPARQIKVIKTYKPCFTIDSSDNYICVVCMDEDKTFCPACLLSLDGIILRSFNTYMFNMYPRFETRKFLRDLYLYCRYDPPHIALLSEKFYYREWEEVCCEDLYGRRRSMVHLGSKVAGICTDKTNENVYICTGDWGRATISLFRLSSDLTQKRKMVDLEYDLYMDRKNTPLCYYKDKVFILNGRYVTVLRIL